MAENKNHIDNWLIQSAALGEIPFDNADWIEMKKLLESKKKRRFLWIWFVVALLLAGLTGYLLLTKNQTTSIVNYSNNHLKVVTVDSITNAKTQAKQQQDSVLLTGEKNKKEHGDIVIEVVSKNLDLDRKEKSNIKSNTDLTTKHKKDISNTTKQQVLKNKNTTNTQIDVAIARANMVADNDLPQTKNITPKQGSFNNALSVIDNLQKDKSTPKYQNEIKYMHNRYIDSLARMKTTKDTTANSNVVILPKPASIITAAKNQTKKNNSKAKNYFEINAGYGLMNVGNTNNNTPALQLQYGLEVNKFLHITTSCKGLLFNDATQQVHKNIYRINRQSGTTFTEVDLVETRYIPAKGFAVEPGLGINLSLSKKIELSITGSFGSVINAVNTVTFAQDTFNFYNGALPAEIQLGGGTYNPNNFIGKQYINTSAAFSYKLNKKWIVTANVSQQLWHNTVEGVLDSRKKSIGYYFTLGYRF